MFYDFDFQGAYDEVKWCEDFLPFFIKDIYYNSFAAEKICNNAYSKKIIDGSIKISEFSLIKRSDTLETSLSYPFVICKFEGTGSIDFYGCFIDGEYQFFTLDLQTDSDYTLSSRKFYYGNEKNTVNNYTFHLDYLEKIFTYAKDNNIVFLNGIPDCINE